MLLTNELVELRLFPNNNISSYKTMAGNKKSYACGTNCLSFGFVKFTHWDVKVFIVINQNLLLQDKERCKTMEKYCARR